jgi:hypothetical protein
MSDKGKDKKDEGTKIQVGGMEIIIMQVKNPSESKDKKSSSPGCIVLALPLLIFAAVVIFFSPQSSAPAESRVRSADVSIQPAVLAVDPPECEPGISAGGWVKVTHLPGARMRASPGYRNKDNSVDTLGYVGYGHRLWVLSGPQMADGLCWWRVRDESCGNEGWVADHAQGGLGLLRSSQ